jgi:predicted membrane-bound spermidine synthase
VFQTDTAALFSMITVASLTSPAGKIVVRRRIQTGALVYEQGDCCQSEIDEHGVSLSSYIHALFSLIWQKRSQHVLMIGCGGGTLATLLVRAGIQVTVVDNNPDAFSLARQYFQMPTEVRCVVADGFDYLKVCNDFYDAVVLDAYNGSKIPAPLRSSQFLQLVKRMLDRVDGVFLANVYLHHDFDLTADRMIHTAGTIWNEVALLDTRAYPCRNSIVMAGAINNFERPTLMVRPTTRSIVIDFELGHLKFRKGRLGGVRAAADKFRRAASR